MVFSISRNNLENVPRVYNKHKAYPPNAVYIGRGSDWGNPYSHLPSGSSKYKTIHVPTREDAVTAFKALCDKHPELRKEIKERLRGKDLVCYCAPLACHGDVLLAIANED